MLVWMIESWLCVVMSSIVMGWACLNWRSLVQENHYQQAGVQLVALLRDARQASIVQQRPVTVCMSEDRQSCADHGQGVLRWVHGNPVFSRLLSVWQWHGNVRAADRVVFQPDGRVMGGQGHWSALQDEQQRSLSVFIDESGLIHSGN